MPNLLRHLIFQKSSLHFQKQPPKVFCRKRCFLKIPQNSQENACARVSFLIKLQASASACNFIKKETLAHVFSCEFCEISKNTFSYRTPPVAASVFTRWCTKLYIIQQSVPCLFQKHFSLSMKFTNLI